MTRKPPIVRQAIVRGTIRRLHEQWTCEHSQWTRDRQFTELEQELKRLRRAGSYSYLEHESLVDGRPVEGRQKGVRKDANYG